MNKLAQALGELNEKLVLEQINVLRGQNLDPLDIITQLQSGMEMVGKKFEQQEFYLSELIHSAAIFKKAVSELGDVFKEEGQIYYGSIVIGTVFDDIHDIGKNLVTSVLSCNGFKVFDLGINVPPEEFIKTISQHKPDFVGISCLLTNTFENTKTTIEQIDKAGLRDSGMKILIGGAPVNESVREYTGADYCCETAQDAVNLCKELMGVSRNE